MNFRKVVTGVLSVTVLTLSSATAFAANAEEVKPINYAGQVVNIMPINSKPINERQANYYSFTGTVKEITDHSRVEGTKYVLVENEEGQIANLVVSKDTYILDGEEIEVGSVITGFYDANAPMLMIYPPQYNTEVVVVNNKDTNIKVDRFDENLVSADNGLKLKISDKTEIVLQDGTDFEGKLENRKLVVLYGPSTRSIPAQTTPDKVVVLFEKAVPPILELTEEDKEKISIEDKDKAEVLPASPYEQNAVIALVRAIAKALGLK